MGFVRTKRIKGNRYAYLVENRWTKAGPRQKSKKYLGRVYDFRREKETQFLEYYKEYDIEVRDKRALLQDSIRVELFNHGFKHKNGIWENDACFIDVKKLKFFNTKGKNIALGLNDGILCKAMLDKVLRLRIDPNKEEIDKEGYALAKLLVESGLKVSHEVFVRLYELTKL